MELNSYDPEQRVVRFNRHWKEQDASWEMPESDCSFLESGFIFAEDLEVEDWSSDEDSDD